METWLTGCLRRAEVRKIKKVSGIIIGRSQIVLDTNFWVHLVASSSQTCLCPTASLASMVVWKQAVRHRNIYGGISL